MLLVISHSRWNCWNIVVWLSHFSISLWTSVSVGLWNQNKPVWGDCVRPLNIIFMWLLVVDDLHFEITCVHVCFSFFYCLLYFSPPTFSVTCVSSANKSSVYLLPRFASVFFSPLSVARLSSNHSQAFHLFLCLVEMFVCWVCTWSCSHGMDHVVLMWLASIARLELWLLLVGCACVSVSSSFLTNMERSVLKILSI